MATTNACVVSHIYEPQRVDRGTSKVVRKIKSANLNVRRRQRSASPNQNTRRSASSYATFSANYQRLFEVSKKALLLSRRKFERFLRKYKRLTAEVRETVARWTEGDEIDDSHLIKCVCKCNAHRVTPLHLIGACGFVDAAELILSTEVGRRLAKIADAAGRLSLHWAAVNGFAHLTKVFVLRGGVDPNATDCRGFAALHYAASAGSSQAAEALIFLGASPFLPGRSQKLPLHQAAAYGHSTLCELLLKSAGDDCSPTSLSLFARTEKGRTAAQLAALAGKSSTCVALLSKCPQLLAVKDDQGVGIFDLATQLKLRVLLKEIRGLRMKTLFEELHPRIMVGQHPFVLRPFPVQANGHAVTLKVWVVDPTHCIANYVVLIKEADLDGSGAPPYKVFYDRSRRQLHVDQVLFEVPSMRLEGIPFNRKAYEGPTLLDRARSYRFRILCCCKTTHASGVPRRSMSDCSSPDDTDDSPVAAVRIEQPGSRRTRAIEGVHSQWSQPVRIEDMF